MPYHFFDHTGDVGFELDAPDLPTLFADAAVALTETITDATALVGLRSVKVTVTAADLDLLLVDWLSELLYRFEVDRWLPVRASVVVRDASPRWALEAVVEGGSPRFEAADAVDPEGEDVGAGGSPLRVLVKAVTYHGLSLQELDGRWRARVVLDI